MLCFIKFQIWTMLLASIESCEKIDIFIDKHRSKLDGQPIVEPKINLRVPGVNTILYF